MQPARFFIAAAGTLLTLVDGSPVSQCSSFSTSSIGSISGYTFEGCFTEASSKRALTGKTLIDDSITVEKCSSFCSTYNFFGLENGRECYCGNALMGGSVPTRLSECSFPCPGNTGELCGAVSRLNIYSKISSSSASGSVSVGFESNSGSSQAPSSGNGGNTSLGSASGSGSSSSGSGNAVGNSNSNPSTGSSNVNGQGSPQQGSGIGNTSPGTGVTTRSPSGAPGGPSSTNIIVASVPSSYPWSNATTKATSSASLATLSRPGTGVFPSPSTISVTPVNSTTINTLYPAISASSSVLTLNSSTSTTILESTITSTSSFVSPSSSPVSNTSFSGSSSVISSVSTETIETTSVTSSSVPTITIEPSSSSAILESSTLSTLVSTSSLDETSITSALDPTTIVSSTIDFSSSSATLDTLTTNTAISTSSLDETSITLTPEPTTILSSTTEPTTVPEITSTLTTLISTPSSTIEPITISDPGLTLTPSASTTSSSASPTSTNLVRDGDFEALSESSTIPWVIKYSNTYVTYNFETPTTQATTYGARSASVTIAQVVANIVWFNQAITLSPNTIYNFSANTRASVISPGCNAYYYIGPADGSITTIVAYTSLPSTNWITNTATYTSTSATDVTLNVRLICTASVTTASRTYYFDNISLVPAAAAIATATPV